MSLKDKNAVVTGGSRGLALGLVDALVAHGAPMPPREFGEKVVCLPSDPQYAEGFGLRGGTGITMIEGAAA